MTRLYIQKLRGNEIKNLTILYSNEYKTQQLIKHQLFTAEVKMITIKLLLTMSLPPDITLRNIKWDNFEILASGKTDYPCKIKETWFIEDLKPPFNVNISSEKLMPY